MLICFGVLAVVIIGIATPLAVSASSSSSIPSLNSNTKPPSTPPTPSDDVNNPSATLTETIITARHDEGNYWFIDDMPEELSFDDLHYSLSDKGVIIFRPINNRYPIFGADNVEIRLVFSDALYILKLYKDGDS